MPKLIQFYLNDDKGEELETRFKSSGFSKKQQFYEHVVEVYLAKACAEEAAGEAS